MLKKDVCPADLFETDEAYEYRWEPVEGGIRVIGYTGSKLFLRIPETIDGQTVTELGNRGDFFYSTVLPTVLLPDTVCRFDPDAFRGDYGDSFGMWFGSLVVPETHPFFRMENGILYSRDMKALYFCFDRTLESYDMPDSVEVVKKSAFRNLESSGLSLDRIRFSANLKTLEDFALSGCGAYREFSLPQGIERLGAQSLTGNLRYLLPPSVRVLDGSPAANFTLQGDAFTVDRHRIAYTADRRTVVGYSSVCPSDLAIFVNSLSFDENAEEILPYAFAQMERLEKLDLGTSVRKIGKKAFARARIRTIRIPAQVEEIDDDAFGFDRCSSVIVDRENRHFRSDRVCFYRMSEGRPHTLIKCFRPAEDYTVPEGVVTILKGAFYGCAALRSLTLPSTLREFDMSCLCDTSVTEIRIPAGVRTLRNLRKSKRIRCTVDEANPYLCIEGGVLYEKNGDSFRAVDAVPGRDRVVIRDGTTEIGDMAFRDMESLASVTLPDTVVRIGVGAFYNCALSEIDLPEGLEVIDDRAFAFCCLTAVRLPDSLRYICRTAFRGDPIKSFEIGSNPRYTVSNGALYTADMRTLLAVPRFPKPKAFTVPAPVEQIGQVFARRRDIREVVLPNSLKGLGYRAMECGPRQLSGGKGLVYIDEDCFAEYDRDREALSFGVTGDPGDPLIEYAKSLRDSGCRHIRISVHGQEGFRALSDRFEVEPNGSGVTLVLLKKAVKNLTVPETVGGYRVTGMAAGALRGAQFNTLTFSSPESVCFEALKLCTFRELILPEGLKELPDNAFSDCETLESVRIPDSLRRIGADAFACCWNLKAVDLGPQLRAIGPGAFRACDRLETVTVPGSVECVAAAAFSGCSGLETAVIEQGVSSIGDAAFFGCKSLKALTVPPSVTRISAWIFADKDHNYRDLYLDGRLTVFVVPGTFADRFFRSYSPNNPRQWLKTVPLSGTDGVPFEEVFPAFDYAFESDGSVRILLKTFGGDEQTLSLPAEICGGAVTSVRFPQGFNSAVRTIRFPKTVKEIIVPEYAFSGWDTHPVLRGIEVDPDNPFYASDGISLFSKDCRRLIRCFSCVLERYVIPEGTETVCASAFADRSTLAEIDLPDTVKTIESRAFAGCGSLTRVSGLADDCAVAADAFDGTPYLKQLPVAVYGPVFKSFNMPGVTSYRVPESITVIAAGAFHSQAACALEELTLPSTLETIEENVFLYSAHYRLKELVIPEGVKALPKSLLADCGSLTRIVLPATMETIPPDALLSQSLKTIDTAPGSPKYRSVDGVLFSADGKLLVRYPAARPAASYVIPEGVRAVWTNAFAGCRNLREVIFPDTLRSIGENAFERCRLGSARLKCRTIGDEAFRSSGLESVELSGTEEIGQRAFEHCRLGTVVLPETLRTIGKDAFSNCGLKSVVLPKSLQRLGVSAFGGCGDLTVYDSFTGSLRAIGGERHPLSSCQVTVRSAETGEIKYVVWHTSGSTDSASDTMMKCWKTGTEYDFDLLDSSYTLIRGTENKLRTAVTRLRFPAMLSAAAEKRYRTYLKRNIDEALRSCIEARDSAGILQLSELGLLRAEDLDRAIEYAVSARATEAGALLMDLKHALPEAKSGSAGAEFDLSDNAPSPWVFSRKSSGLIGRYRGSASELIFPEEIDGVRVNGIAGTTSKVPLNYLAIVSVVIPEGYRSIGAYAFYGCENLETVSLPSTLEEIGKSAFENCAKLREIVIPEGVRELPQETFCQCASLAAVTLPNTLETIRKNAFQGCASLTEIDLPRGVTFLEKHSFVQTGLRDVYLHAPRVRFDGAAFGWSSLTYYAYRGAISHNYGVTRDNTRIMHVASYPGDASVTVTVAFGDGSVREESFFLEKTWSTILDRTRGALRDGLREAGNGTALAGFLDSVWSGALSSPGDNRAALARLCDDWRPEAVRLLTIREEKRCVDGYSVATAVWNRKSVTMTEELTPADGGQ